MEARVRAPRRTYSFTYSVAVGEVSETGDAALTAAILPAMRWGGTLQVDAPVSPRLMANLDAVQEAFLANSRGFRPVQVQAGSAPGRAPSTDGGVACFFSGGVDSFYSVASHLDELTHLVFIHGFDIPLGERALRARVAARLRQAAQELGLELIEVETDVRRFSDRFVDFPGEYFGALLASTAQLLSPMLRKAYIASSYGPGQGVFSGSTPEIDPLWSTEAVEIVHDTQVLRLEKFAAIAEFPVALRHLRMCFENRGGEYNCGRCRKCLMGMACLRLVGALGRCETFPATLDLDALAHTQALPPTPFLKEFLAAAEAAGDRPLAHAFRTMLERATPRQIAVDRLKTHIRTGLRYRLAGLRR
jgi:hypothetical protein